MAKGQGGVETKSVIDLVLVKSEMLRYVQDVRAARGMPRSRHYSRNLVLKKVAYRDGEEFCGRRTRR